MEKQDATQFRFVVDFTFWIAIIVALLFRQGYFVGVYFVAVVLHELAHYVVASRLFYHCQRIKLSIFGAVLYGDFADIQGTERVKVALAGPLCNVTLCLLCAATWWIVPSSYYFTEQFFTANLGMALVNLLPCYPLDGGMVLTGILEKFTDKSVAILQKITIYVSLATFSVFVLSLANGHNLFSLGLFSICLFSGVFVKNDGNVYAKSLLGSKFYLKRYGMEKKTLVFFEESTIADVAKRLKGNKLYCLEVVDDDLHVVAKCSYAQLEELVLQNNAAKTLKQCLCDGKSNVTSRPN